MIMKQIEIQIEKQVLSLLVKKVSFVIRKNNYNVLMNKKPTDNGLKTLKYVMGIYNTEDQFKIILLKNSFLVPFQILFIHHHYHF